MANTGNTQQQINYGASANDGQGDPLRTAFIKTDDNFDNVWLAGPVGSNITIGNNTIQSNNTNGNIILKPNGTGIVQANASIIPNADGVRDLGSSTLAWRRAYIDELLPTDLTVTGDATIGGNLTVEGDTIQIGNITTDTLTIQLANTAANATAATGAGITVGANDAIATFLFNSSNNVWITNIGANVSGNLTADNIRPTANLVGSVGTGNSVWQNIRGNVVWANTIQDINQSGQVSIIGNVTTGNVFAAGNVNTGNLNVSNNITGVQNLNAKTGTFTGDATGDNSIYAGVPLFTVLGSSVVAQFSGNTDAYTQFNFQNGNSGSMASGDYVITANNGDDETFFFNMGLGSNNHSDPDFFGDTSTPNDAYIYVVGADATGPGDTGPGNLLIGSTNGVIKMFVGNTAQANVVQTISTTGVTVTGNITAGNVSATGNITGNTAGFAIGYRDIPQVSFTGNATIATIDAGKHFYSTQSTDYILTIANNASQGFQTGAAITVINQGTGNITLAQGSGVTLYLTGNATSGNRTVTTFGMATLIKVATDTWFVSGAGVI